MYDNNSYPNSDNTQYGSNTMQKENRGAKTGKAGRILAVMCSGILFGCCAGLSIVIILHLFPQETGSGVESNAQEKVEIEQTEGVNKGSVDEYMAEAEPETEAGSSSGSAEAYTQEGGIDATKTTDSETDQADMAVVTDVTNVVDSVMPSVVSIFGTYEVTENFWGYEMQQEQEGSGSGIIVGENEDELLLVTNNHVVADSTSLSVQFINDERCDAVIKGTDAEVDLAVIAVDLSSLPEETKEAIKIATLGDSDTLKVGEPAIAIGNALGYGQSVTTGVISAVNREYSMSESGSDTFLIQTDAAINPGNSGGALLNVYGEVIGINSNKIAGTTVEGMGYAIPISTAKPIIEELMSKKTRVPVSENQKGYLGISGINVNEEVHATYGLPVGVYIAQVFDGTAAQKAGLKKGDIITSFDGEAVETMDELSALLDYSKAGSVIQVGVMISARDGYEEQIIAVTLGGRD